MPLLDLTHSFFHQMPVFPGEAKPSITEDKLPDDANYVTYRLEANMHSGTHMDTAYHVCHGNRTIDSYPLDYFTGRAKVIDVRGQKEVLMLTGWEQIFRKYKMILFCTGQDEKWNSTAYYQDYPVFADEIANALVKNGVRIVGIDSPSPDKSPFPFHEIFLEESNFIIENLTNLNYLTEIEDFELIAFPLKIQAEASIIRAVARY